ncbi:MAG: BamA/TamA family outer membrane protein [Sphingomonadales bacterium]|nr:BamA/TamA family outer membrane protein [Sphingomonadales bacterium]
MPASRKQASRAPVTHSSERLLRALVAVSLALAPATLPGLATAQGIDQELKDLVPDAAVADPEGWAKSTPPAGSSPSSSAGVQPPPGQPGELDPGSPLANLPGLSVAWPDADPDKPEGATTSPALASLPPDPDVAQALADEQARPQLEVVPAGEEIRVAPHLTLVFPANLATFPEREAFLDRFRALSTLRTLASDNDTIAQIAARARVDKDLLDRLLRVYGYYDAIVLQTVGGSAADGATSKRSEDGIAVRFDVAPGDRFRFGTIDLGNLAAAGPDAPALRESVGIKPGDPLDNDRIVAGRDKLDVDLGETGYAFAEIGAPELLVDHKRLEGDLAIPVEPRGKYNFGHIVSQNPRFLSSHHLEDIARFEPGDLYRRTGQEDLKRAILATGLVSSVTVTPREVAPPPAPGQPGEVVLDVAVIPGPLRTVAGLAGYESGEGLRLEASWEHRNFFPSEGMLRVRGVAGTNEQLLGTTVRWNNFHGRDQVFTLDLTGNTVDRESYNARTVGFSATFEKLTTLTFQKPWVWSLGLEVLATAERESVVAGQAVPRTTYYIAALPARGAFDYSDNLLDPTRGWRTALRVSPEYSKEQGGPTVTYARVQADASAYQPVTGGVVLAERVRVGSIQGAGLESIAPSRRFYAGGGGSVRGFGYQAIGPRDSAGDPSGGRSLVEFSLEARVDTGLLGGAVQLVPFIDAGTVSESATPTLDGMRYGAGLGLRYKTDFGPLRLDIGTPLNRRAGDGRITVSVALGQAF